LQFLITYTWSKSIDDSSIYDDNITYIGSFTSLQDPNKPWLERSLSTLTFRTSLQFTYTYDLPVGRGRAFLGNLPRALDAIVGGWKTNGIWRISAGRRLPSPSPMVEHLCQPTARNGPTSSARRNAPVVKTAIG